MPSRKRYAIVGTGGRSVMYIEALTTRYRESAELVAMCDVSPTRMEWYNRRIESEFGATRVPAYTAADFDRMVRETKPDGVIVTTPDYLHDTYVIRAMELGCDAICEKPLTTEPAKARAIFEAVDRTKRDLKVTFNARYVPAVAKVHELVRGGAVGRVTAVDFSWVLDTRHGADYFRRWHREKDKSGGLLIHKASHHFDMANWWIGSVPKTVFAMGELKFYGRRNAEARGDAALARYPRYTGAAEAKDDPFRLVLDEDEHLRGLYLDAETDSGYVRDRNVFGDDITAEDTMAICCRYRGGVIMNYSLIAYSPWEGYRVAITGDRGRLEVQARHGSHVIAGQTDAELAAEQAGEGYNITLFPMFKPPQKIEAPRAAGAHGGGDAIMLEQLFSANPPADPLHRAATHIDGAASILLGMAANASIASGKPVEVDDLLKLPATVG